MKKNYFKNITYVDKISTPLLWHNFNRFFRIPLSILIYSYCTIKAFGSSLWLIGIFGTVSVIAMLYFEFNSFSWNADVIIGIYTFIVNNFYLGIMICIHCSLPVLTLVAVFVLCVLEYLYYYKRRNLFKVILNYRR